MNAQELKQKVDELGPWHYCHLFPHGIKTGDGNCDPEHDKVKFLRDAGAFRRPAYKNVLDLGANSGLIAMWFADNKYSVVRALEAGPKYYPQLELAVEVKGYQDTIFPVEQDIRDEGAFGTPNYYDLVLFLGVMHHIAEMYWPDIFRKCKNALVPGGEIVVQTRSDLPVPDMLRQLSFIDVRKLCDWPSEHNKSAWQATKDSMKL